MAINRFRIRFSVLAVIYVPALIILALSALASLYTDISIAVFLRDPTATLGAHPLVGVQSNLGVLVWCTAAAVCLFTSVILRCTQVDKTLSFFILGAGVITSVLLFDDFFLLHEDLLRRYLPLGGEISFIEEIIFAGYGLVMALYIARFRKNILGFEYLLLFLAFVFFGLSVVIDLLDNRIFLDKWNPSWSFFFEDGFKFLGIVSWSAYWIRACFRAIASGQKREPV